MFRLAFLNIVLTEMIVKPWMELMVEEPSGVMALGRCGMHSDGRQPQNSNMRRYKDVQALLGWR